MELKGTVERLMGQLDARRSYPGFDTRAKFAQDALDRLIARQAALAKIQIMEHFLYELDQFSKEAE